MVRPCQKITSCTDALSGTPAFQTETLLPLCIENAAAWNQVLVQQCTLSITLHSEYYMWCRWRKHSLDMPEASGVAAGHFWQAFVDKRLHAS